jgi:hypothetical protein
MIQQDEYEQVTVGPAARHATTAIGHESDQSAPAGRCCNSIEQPSDAYANPYQYSAHKVAKEWSKQVRQMGQGFMYRATVT